MLWVPFFVVDQGFWPKTCVLFPPKAQIQGYEPFLKQDEECQGGPAQSVDNRDVGFLMVFFGESRISLEQTTIRW